MTVIAGTKEQIRNDSLLQSAKVAAEERIHELFREYVNQDDDDEDTFADLDSDSD